MRKAGDIVQISNCTMGGKDFTEGKAELIKPITPSGLGNGQLWEVHFLKDTKGETYMRWIREES